MLAEDNITNQQVAMGILNKLGLRADVVANGAEALKALEQIPYDLVLMDVQMPEPHGLSDIFDRSVFVHRMMGDEDLANMIITGFLEDMPGQVSILRDLVQQNQVQQARGQAHKIKGAEANITAMAMENAGRIIHNLLWLIC